MPRSKKPTNKYYKHGIHWQDGDTAKGNCVYCFGHGISKFWWETGTTDQHGNRHPVRIPLKKPSLDSMPCDRCGSPSAGAPSIA